MTRSCTVTEQAILTAKDELDAHFAQHPNYTHEQRLRKWREWLFAWDAELRSLSWSVASQGYAREHEPAAHLKHLLRAALVDVRLHTS